MVTLRRMWTGLAAAALLVLGVAVAVGWLAVDVNSLPSP